MLRSTVLGLLVAVMGGILPASAQTEGGATCLGHAVTISWRDPGVGTTINGTGGPDVILGGDDSETIDAGGGEDVVCAGGGFDTIDGGAGRDELLGQDGSDTFTGADLGQDVITGGRRDSDVARYSQLPAGVQIDLSQGLVHMTGAGVNGGILGVETVAGTPFDDQLLGRSGADVLLGLRGNDTIDGRGGSNDLDGGPGDDTVSYASSSEKVRVDLANDHVTRAHTEDLITDFETAIGSPFADRLLGTDENDHLIGGGQDDVLKGRLGDDVLEGGGGDDVIHPGPGDDFVDGGTNDPVRSSGEHGDLVSYQGDTLDPGRTFLDVGLYFFAPLNSPPYALGVGDDSLSGIESVRGMKHGKTHVQGDDGPNVIIGGDGQDFLNARGGNDLVFGLGGADILNGDYAAGENPLVFGNDYLDGGDPDGPGDPDRVHGNGGDDTCTGAIPDGDNMDSCETIF